MYALVQDATGKTAAEIHQMGKWDRHLTALLRGRFYEERNGNGGEQKPP